MAVASTLKFLLIMVDFHGKYSSYVIDPGERRQFFLSYIIDIPIDATENVYPIVPPGAGNTEMMEGTEG